MVSPSSSSEEKEEEEEEDIIWKWESTRLEARAGKKCKELAGS